MNNEHSISAPKGRSFNGKYYPKIKRVRQEARMKIRQLLRSFFPSTDLRKLLKADSPPIRIDYQLTVLQ